jgi:hypothetical protein
VIMIIGTSSRTAFALGRSSKAAHTRHVDVGHLLPIYRRASRPEHCFLINPYGSSPITTTGASRSISTSVRGVASVKRVALLADEA